jgi:adenosylmethionine-8-amino-7-oxononanoate aminotransferase
MADMEDAMANDTADLRNDVHEMARRHLLQPWPTMGTVGEEVKPFVDRGEGIYIWDEQGRRLIDGPAGMWCVQIGHRRAEMADAIARQVMELPYYSPWYTSNGPAARLAERIAAETPGDLDRVFFTTGGSTAVDTALRFVQFFNNVLGRRGKKKVISRVRAYHGSSTMTAALSGRPADRGLIDEMPDLVRRVSAPYPYRRPEGMSVADYCDFLVRELEEAILEEGPENVAAFVAEPILASGGVIVPPEGYHRRTAEICRKYDVLVISDEVVTAFGRLGHWFASEDLFGFEPDIVTFAKGVSSGYVPLGGLAISERLFDRMKATPEGKGALWQNGYTYSSHPVACAAALTNIAIIERDGLLDHVRTIAPYFQAALKTLGDLPLVGDVRGLGLMACVECVADRKTRAPMPADANVGKRIDRYAQEIGLLVRPLGDMCVMSPPLIIQKPQIDDMANILRRAITRTMDDLVREGLWHG